MLEKYVRDTFAPFADKKGIHDVYPYMYQEINRH